MYINQNKNNSYYMGLALKQAKINLGNTKENPSVGCVIVNKNQLIGAGVTSLNGRPHGEYNAIKSVKKNLKNSIIYVTLEPCSHFGLTPPCVNLIIKKKIKKVFFSILDPDKRTFNKSKKILNKNKILVKKGIFSNSVKKFYESYILYKKKRLPYVTYKMAVSKDFYTVNNKKKWITNVYSRSRVHLMRANHDCIISTSKTVIKDNPRLDCRIPGLENKSPSRIILDSKLNIPINSNIVKTAKKNPTIIFYNKEKRSKISILNKRGIKLYKVSLNKNNKLNIKEILYKIGKIGYSRVFVESGKTLAKSFLSEKLINEFNLFISNYKFNNRGKNNIKKFFNVYFRNALKKKEKVNLFGEQLINYKLK